MHANANVALERQESSRLLDTIISLQPKVPMAGGSMSRTASNLGNVGKTGSAEKNLSQLARRSPEDEVYSLAQELLEKLPPNIAGPSAHPSSRPATQQVEVGGGGVRAQPHSRKGGLGGGGVMILC